MDKKSFGRCQRGLCCSFEHANTKLRGEKWRKDKWRDWRVEYIREEKRATWVLVISFALFVHYVHFQGVMITWLWWLFCSGQKKTATSCVVNGQTLTHTGHTKHDCNLTLVLHLHTAKHSTKIKKTLIFLSFSSLFLISVLH